jgi:hypothetical protein
MKFCGISVDYLDMQALTASRPRLTGSKRTHTTPESKMFLALLQCTQSPSRVATFLAMPTSEQG